MDFDKKARLALYEDLTGTLQRPHFSAFDINLDEIGPEIFLSQRINTSTSRTVTIANFCDFRLYLA